MFKNLLYFSILTSVIVLSWIGFELYNSHVTSTISKDQSIIITPIPPDFNAETILLIKSKKIVPVNLSQSSTRSAVTVPIVTQNTPAVPESSPSAQQSVTPTQAQIPVNL